MLLVKTQSKNRFNTYSQFGFETTEKKEVFCRRLETLKIIASTILIKF